jgi:uncharacterized RDD family membrane protein YckC
MTNPESTDAPAPPALSQDQTTPRPFAGFWRRLGAFVIDTVILALVGALMGLTMSSTLAELGGWGRVLGFAIALAYFGLFNSRIGGGQTPGKQLLKIKVVGRNGELLSLQKSLLRFVPLGLPWFLNNAPVPGALTVTVTAWSPVVMGLLGFGVFGLGLSIIHLFLFNRPSRRSLHDYVVGSTVVPAQAAGEPAWSPLKRMHQAVCAALLAASALGAPVVALVAPDISEFAPLVRAYHALHKEPWIANAHVYRGSSTFKSFKDGQSKSTRHVDIRVQSRDPRIDDLQRVQRVVAVVLEASPELKDTDVIRVAVSYGFDIGIASGWKTVQGAYPPAEWPTVHLPKS